ncbi:MAG: HEAT repeat domain-containing protein [Phycisphaerae bacterium]
MRLTGSGRGLGWGVGGVLMAAGLSGAACFGPHEVRVGIQSRDALGRSLAIHNAGESNDRLAIPLLIDRLEDEDPAVRLFAILALEKLAGRRFGYDYAKPAVERAASVARWRTYAEAGQHLTAAGGAGGESDGPLGRSAVAPPGVSPGF